MKINLKCCCGSTIELEGTKLECESLLIMWNNDHYYCDPKKLILNARPVDCIGKHFINVKKN